MKLFHGIDISNVKRIQDMIEKGGDRVLDRIFTEGERKYCEEKRNKYEYYAARFSAKEAAVKAFSECLGVTLEITEIEVRNQPSGKPFLFFEDDKKKKYGISDAMQIELSLSHERDYAVASVIVFVHE